MKKIFSNFENLNINHFNGHNDVRLFSSIVFAGRNFCHRCIIFLLFVLPDKILFHSKIQQSQFLSFYFLFCTDFLSLYSTFLFPNKLKCEEISQISWESSRIMCIILNKDTDNPNKENNNPNTEKESGVLPS